MNKGKIQIALFGTSADPPTYGHQALLKGLLTLFPKVVTWASDNPMKEHSAPLKKRYLLLNAMVKSISNPALELAQELSSPWTIITLKKAAQQWPHQELVFVIGSDLATHVPKWENAKSILKKARLGIAPRKGWPITTSQLNTLKSLGGQIDLLPLIIPPSASSEIRVNPELNQIPPSVRTVVQRENLYGVNRKI